MQAEEIDSLFAATLQGAYDDEPPWKAVSALHRLGTREVFGRAAGWCESEDPLKRARGADVIAQLGRTIGHRANSFPEESFLVISSLLQKESDRRVLASAISALGHLGDHSAIPLIYSHRAHLNSDVRFSVAFALGCFPNDPLSIETLIELMADVDDDVRDWATFGLGVLGVSDTTEIRNALVARLADSDEDVREEATVGLGKRKDVRVLTTLNEMLHRSEPPDRAMEAASLMLDREHNEPDWTAREYISELNTRFGP